MTRLYSVQIVGVTPGSLMGEYTVFGVAGLQPGLTLKRSEIGCGSVRKVVVSTVANHNHGCGERGYSLVRANINGETENMRNL